MLERGESWSARRGAGCLGQIWSVTGEQCKPNRRQFLDFRPRSRRNRGQGAANRLASVTGRLCISAVADNLPGDLLEDLGLLGSQARIGESHLASWIFAVAAGVVDERDQLGAAAAEMASIWTDRPGHGATCSPGDRSRYFS